MKRKNLISDLKSRTLKAIERANTYKELDETDLNHWPSDTSWSILECLEHLNLYGDFLFT